MTTNCNQSLQLEPASDGSLTVWINSPGRSVNVLDADMLAAWEAALEHIVHSQRYRLVIIRSRKLGCFYAGADVHAIVNLNEPEQAHKIIRRGQQLMQRIADLPIPSVAIIDGMCMGGGLELAMACTYRVATDASETRLSLPEIRLGLIPGWGGTQRLPRLVGMRQALKMILKGSALNARQARQVGLVDQILHRFNGSHDFKQLETMLLDGTYRSPTQRPGLKSLLLRDNPLGSWLTGYVARRQIAPQAVYYPALSEAIAAVQLAYKTDQRGFDYEAEAFTRLLFTPTAQSLLNLFVARDRAKKISTWLHSTANAPRINQPHSQPRLAVVGAGSMGAGIGLLAAQHGMQVVFKEVDEAAAYAGLGRVHRLLAAQVAAGRMSNSQQQQIEARCTATANWDELGPCDLAIEAAVEVDSVKREVFQQLDRCLPQEAVLVSNTSSLNITHMAVATQRKGQVAGLHFFNPVDRMELVEVVRTEMTDEATVAKLLALVKQLGKVPIVTSDKPGFLVNRVLFPYLGEAVRMVAEGYSITGIDAELRQFGMPMGPLELLDQVGIDVASHVAAALSHIQVEAELPTSLLRTMHEHGWLGKKTGLGFYRWGKRRRPNLALQPHPVLSCTPVEWEADGLTHIQRRLVYPMLNEAVHCLDELVVMEAWMVDLGMVLGTGFAPHRGGPLRMIDAVGAEVVLRNMLLLERTLGNRFAPADGLAARATRRQPFFTTGRVSNPLTWETQHESGCTTES
jgi:3-hydroxyacyl-CoA dehydrogenase/enoyl-CoA hydratase/carnithine racemase